MTDNLTPAQRRENMQNIRSKNSRPEILVRSFLHRNGYRFRLHQKNLPGKPDIVLPKYKTIIFVNGCFWHGHKNCKYFVIPKTRTNWWLNKIERNRKTDKKNNMRLRKEGWEVVTLWECKLKPKSIEKTLTKLIKYLNEK